LSDAFLLLFLNYTVIIILSE